ncbi:MAG TPA: ABC transporter ATP-binding protein [Steroidobacteraceae bacterium]|nr:ABC transporter ATP-binding protein [Steroidobacteraceae bacterium]
MNSETTPLAAVRNITKRFPGVLANERISLEFHAAEIHVLLGENGAGKSTLISMLAGMQQPDEGEIWIGGGPVVIASPRASLALGVGTVFQHELLVPSLTVIENLLLGGRWWQRMGQRAALERFRQLSGLLGVAIDPHAEVGRLSLGERQQIEIIRALWRGGKLLILDEPTSMLTPHGVQDLGRVMQRLKEQGVAVLLVTHKLPEAFQFGNRISVLRQGRLMGQLAPERIAKMSATQAQDAVIGMMFGGQVAPDADTAPGVHLGQQKPLSHREGPPRLSVRALCTEGRAGECALREVSFDVWAGEILGIAGVDGNGQKHLAEVLAGQRSAVQGRIILDGTEVTRDGVGARRQRGFRYLTDDRLHEGSVGALSVAINLLLKEIGEPPYWRHGVADWDLIHREARATILRNDIRAPSERTPLGRLSGGNIQKVLLARELDRAAKVAILSKPTHGLDLQNCALAHARMRADARRGVAIVVISTDLDDELLQLSDRIGVMVQGRLSGIVPNASGVERTVGRLMTGAASA